MIQPSEGLKPPSHPVSTASSPHIEQGTDIAPGGLEFLVQADGAFFALAQLDGHLASEDIDLFLEDSQGAPCGKVVGSARRGNGKTTAVFCGDSMLLTGAAWYRLGLQARQPLASMVQHAVARNKAWRAPTHRWPRLWAYVRRGMFLLASGQFAVLTEKIGRYRSPAMSPPSGDGDDIQAWLARLVGERGLVLMVDHGLGGGATRYCQNSVAAHLQTGDAVLVVTSEPLSGNYVLNLHTGDGVELRRATDLSALLEIPQRLRLAHIVYNTAALFVSPLALVALMIRLQQASGATLQVLFHDYFPVCPSFFLLGADGRYCGVPDEQACRRCLPHNRSMPVPLRHYRHYDPILWRQVWQCLLVVADNSIAFSNASAAILRKVWPELDEARMQVVPHQADALTEQPVVIRQARNLHIGIVGQIGPHKGIEVISELAKAIRRRKLKVRISVIGSVEARMDRQIVSQTGHYKREDMPGLIAESGANVMLFPSIWPETFSYVVQELMALQLPVACFDMGAPAERVRHYEKGLILGECDADTILDQLTAFHKQLYPGG